MTEDEAAQLARARGEEDAEHRYFAREKDGEWEVVRVAAPPGQAGPTRTSTEARPRPEADDPRTSMDRQIGPFGAGGF